MARLSRSIFAAASIFVASTAWAAGCGDTAATTSSTAGPGGSNSGGAGGAGGSAPVCGDSVCDASESCDTCPIDCGSCCGNGTCDANELCGTCPVDCGTCTGALVNVVRGPYLQRGSTSEVVLRWRTSEPRASAVAYGLTPSTLSQVVVSETPTTEHEVVMNNLLPDSQFHYAFGAPESALTGADGDHFVVTPPTKGTNKPTRIWAIGDSGTANADAAHVRDAYLQFTGARHTDLWLMLGDNAYDTGTDAQYQAAVFNTYPSLLRNTVLWATLGNHDGYSADSGQQSGPYYDIFTLPKQAEAGGVASGTEAYYAFDYGQIHFVCLDSYDSDTDPDGTMMTWLKNDLAANDQPWLIAFFHHPPYTKGSHDSDTESQLIDMRVNALPILEDHGVDLVLSGHSHSYERSFLLNGHYGDSTTLDASMIVDGGDGQSDGDGAYSRAVSDSDGAVYVVAGSSGKTSSAPLDHPAMFISLEELGSVVIDVDGLTLDVSFIDDAGAARDGFTLRKN